MTQMLVLNEEELDRRIISNVKAALLEYSSEQKTKSEKPISIKEAAEMLEVSPATIHNWKKQGLVPFYKQGNRVYFKKDELLASLRKININ